jgi:hypothetical protein
MKARLFVDFVGIDQDFADVRLEVVADGADDQAAFLIDQEGALAAGRRLRWRSTVAAGSSGPTAILRPAADSGGAGDQAHAVGYFELIHDFAQFGAFVTFDAAGNATATRVVRHQDQVAAGQRNKVVRAAPLLPRSSLSTWTMSSWPSSVLP